MDIQPSLSPFSPSLSYSLLVDDLFNTEEQTALTTITDDEIYDDDDSATFEIEETTLRTETATATSLQQSCDEFLRDCNDNVILKDVDVTNDLELGAVIIKEREEGDFIVFNPRINDVKEEIVKSHNEDLRFLDSKENVIFDVSGDYHIINAKSQSRETHKSFLMTSLCSPQPASPAPPEACPAFCIHNQSQSNTPPSSSASSPGPPSPMLPGPPSPMLPGPPSPMLPPCRVCGEKASGFHYGANTCEACKGFFRRSLQRKQSYRCLGSNNCDILSGKRNVCAACRYQKCLSLGMSKNAIKTGRYTHAKKTKDIQEVKRLQRQQQLVHETHNNIDSIIRFENCCETVNEEAAEKLVEKIMKTHRQQTPHTPEFFEKLPHKEHEYMVRRKLKQKVFGPLKPISYDEYSNIYHSTGIDVDGRRAMLEHMLPCIERAVKRFVTFAKAVPGFKELPLEDQIKLIKGSRFEAWLISSYRAFNPDHLLYTHYCGNTVHLEGMARLYDESFLKDIFKMVGMIKKLDLTEEEECVVKAILILFRDRCILQAPELVEKKQMNLIQALDQIHKRRKPKDRIFFGKLLAVLTEMRTLTDLHTSQENKIQTEWSKDICMPPLLYELFYV